MVFETVYTPKETRLLREAKEVGCATASGLTMFVKQAVEQFKLFTGYDAPAHIIKEHFDL